MISIDFTLILVILNFILLLIILKKLLYKSLVSFLNKRQKQIKDNLENAKRSQEESAKMLESQKEMLHKARKEAREIREEAITNAKITGEQILKAANTEKDVLMTETQKIIEGEVKKAKKSIEKEIGEFVVSLTDKIIGKKLTEKDDIKLINNLIKTERKQSKERKVD